jgi:4-oxalocrotonate tautomerase
VNIKITQEDASDAQKAQLIQESTEMLARILGKNPATTVVVIEEVPMENWGIGGKSVRQIRGQHTS